MSCEGTMIGLPLAGERMLLVDIIRTRASSCASSDSGTCTAIWSPRSEEHTSELQSLMRISYAVFCLKKKKYKTLRTPKIYHQETPPNEPKTNDNDPYQHYHKIAPSRAP